MVQQLEAETADNGENSEAGRVPAGFCTSTCAVYKLQQLCETLLKSYPSGDPTDPSAREYYTEWKDMKGPGKDMSMNKNVSTNWQWPALAQYLGIAI